jgi:hypothetical protein
MRLLSRSLAVSSVSTLIKTLSAVCPWLESLVAARQMCLQRRSLDAGLGQLCAARDVGAKLSTLYPCASVLRG